MNQPITTRETALDPILMEVVRYKLESITEEMQSSLIRGSFSPIVKEALDASCCLFTPDGTTVAQSRSNPSHLRTLGKNDARRAAQTAAGNIHLRGHARQRRG